MRATCRRPLSTESQYRHHLQCNLMAIPPQTTKAARRTSAELIAIAAQRQRQSEREPQSPTQGTHCFRASTARPADASSVRQWLTARLAVTTAARAARGQESRPREAPRISSTSTYQPGAWAARQRHATMRRSSASTQRPRQILSPSGRRAGGAPSHVAAGSATPSPACWRQDEPGCRTDIFSPWGPPCSTHTS